MKRTFTLLLVCLSFFVNAQQSIKSISPGSSTQGEKLTISISGQHTTFTQATNIVRLTGQAEIWPQSTITVNDSLIKADFIFTNQHTAGSYGLEVISGSRTLNLPGAFTLYADNTPPSLVSVTPSTATQGDLVTVTITGLNTNFSAGYNLVSLSNLNNSTNSNDITVIGNTTIVARFKINYNIAPGSYNVKVSNLTDGELILANAFTLNQGNKPPHLTAVSPNHGAQGEMLTVAISGQNTHFTQATNYIQLVGANYITAQEYNIANDSLLYATFNLSNDYQPGIYNLSINSLIDGPLSLANAFTLNADNTPPSLVSISPATASQGDIVTVTIKGLNTNFSSGYNLISLTKLNNSISSNSITVIDNTTIEAKFRFNYSSMPGSYNVRVYNSINGNLILLNAFTLNQGNKPPHLVSISPNKGKQGETLTVAISGQNTSFKQASNYVSVQLVGANYINPQSYDIVNDSLLYATFNLDYQYQPGLYNLTVNSLFDGPQVIENAFTLKAGNNPPRIVNVTPNKGKQGETLTLTISGQNTRFTQASNYTNVKLVGTASIINAVSYTVINTATIKAVFSFSYQNSPGVYNVSVSDLDGTITLANAFTLKAGADAARIVSISPDRGAPNETLTINISGQNTAFTQASNVVSLVGGATITPQYITVVNDELIKATFSFNTSHPTGNYDISVYNAIDYSLNLKNAFKLRKRSFRPLDLSLNRAEQGETLTLSIEAEDLFFENGNAGVYLENNNSKIIPTNTVIKNGVISASFSVDRNAAPGYYNVVVEVSDEDITYSEGFLVTKSKITSVGDVVNDQLVSIFPNPSAGATTVEVNTALEGAQIFLYNLLGAEIQHYGNINASTKIDLAEYPRGIYFIKIEKGNFSKVEKIVKE